MNKNKLGRFLTLILRHKPEEIGITLDEEGWVDTDVLLAALKASQEKKGKDVFATMDDLEVIVATSDKKRFALSEDSKRIRANQGHSVDVDLGLEPVEPPTKLYHGTGESSVDSIMQKGLLKMDRHAVHLSADITTAVDVGFRKGKPVVLDVLAKDMASDGYKFFLSDNGVWLTDCVPPKYIKH